MNHIHTSKVRAYFWLLSTKFKNQKLISQGKSSLGCIISHSLVNCCERGICSPTHKELPQINKACFWKRLCKYVSYLLLCINGSDVNCPIIHKVSEVMVLDGYVLSPGCEFRTLCNLDATLVVFPNLASEEGLLTIQPKYVSCFFH